MRKIRGIKALSFLFVFALLLSPALAAPVGNCNAEVKSIQRVPDSVQAGNRVTLKATYELSQGAGTACNFLMESSIKKGALTYATVKETSNSICCPANDNYAAKQMKMSSWFGNTKEVTVKFNLKAPEPGMVDHCPPAGENPQEFWGGEGYYDATFGVYNGCWKDLKDDFEVYDSATDKIRVYSTGGNGDDTEEIEEIVRENKEPILLLLGVGVALYLFYGEKKKNG